MTEEPPDIWHIHIQAVPRTTLGRYIVTLKNETGKSFGGESTHGWHTWTLQGAYRKGHRELRRKHRTDKAVAHRQAQADLLTPYLNDLAQREANK